MVAAASGAGALIPLPGLSVALDLVLLRKEVDLYKSQLGLPEEMSSEFRRCTPVIRAKAKRFCLTSAVQIANLVKFYISGSAVEEFTRYIPFVGCAIAGGISFSSTYYFLQGCLNELEGIALDSIRSRGVREDMDFD